MSLIDDIATQLQTAGIGTVGTDIFKSYLPDNVTNSMAVLDTGGTQPDPDIPTKEPTFQIVIRNATYSAGKTLLDAIRSALHQKANVTYGSTYFYFILAISEGGHLGRNDNGFDEFSINFRARIR